MGQTGQVVRGDVSLFCDTLHKQRNGKKKTTTTSRESTPNDSSFYIYIYYI